MVLVFAEQVIKHDASSNLPVQECPTVDDKISPNPLFLATRVKVLVLLNSLTCNMQSRLLTFRSCWATISLILEFHELNKSGLSGMFSNAIKWQLKYYSR
jgi:hypothetical protein